MSKELKQTHPNFKPEKQLTTPFHKAEQEHQKKVGEYILQARNWRIIAIGNIGVATIAIFGLIYQSTKSRVEPFPIRINSDGVAQPIRMDTTNKMPQLKEIKYFLGQFVINIRSIPLDVVVAKQNYVNAYGYMTNTAATILEQYYAKEASPTAKIGKRAVTVEIKSILPQSKDSYQIQWQENEYELDGKLIDSYKMTGLFTTAIKPPESEADILRNPLGIYIKNFSWSKDFSK